jgi:hypothetical protein
MRNVYTISPCLFVCYVSMFSLYFTIFWYVYVSKVLTLFHHTICIFMYPCVYSISPYFWYVYVSKLLALFHYTDMLCVQAFYPVSYVSELFTLFPISLCMFMCPHLCTISPYILIMCVMYPYLYAISPYIVVCYVSMFSLYFTILLCLCVQGTYTISPYIMCLCIHVFVLFHHIY